jgi:hypothetical protein
VLCQQKPTATFGKPVDLHWSPTIWRPLDQAFVAETKKVSMELAAATKRQTASNLSGVVPASITKRLEHQALQFPTLPHTAILPAFVSTLLFVKRNTPENQLNERNGKSLHFAKRFTGKFTFELFPLFLVEKVCKLCSENIIRLSAGHWPYLRIADGYPRQHGLS